MRNRSITWATIQGGGMRGIHNPAHLGADLAGILAEWHEPHRCRQGVERDTTVSIGHIEWRNWHQRRNGTPPGSGLGDRARILAAHADGLHLWEARQRGNSHGVRYIAA